MNYTDYINKSIKCDCGRLHSCKIKEAIIKDNAIKELAGIIEKNNYKSIYIAADENTWKAAGKWTLKAIEQAARGTDKRREIKITKYIFKDINLLSDEISIAMLLIHAPSECDLIIGIGSGTINDMCKLISKKMKKDYAIVATAPSMSGFSTNVSQLVINHLKTTIITKQPDYIICDLRILCKSPKHMIAAGAADILEKHVRLADWKLSELINEEYYCSDVEKIIEKSTESAEEAIKPHISDETKDFLQNKKLIKTIMESLIMSGIALTFMDDFNSLSESGHDLLYYYEMRLLQEENTAIPYGFCIAVSTVKKIKLYEKLKKIQPDFKEVNCKKKSDTEVEKRLIRLEENWGEAGSIMNTLPSSDYITGFLKATGLPYKAKHLGISKEAFKESINNSKESGESCGLLQILNDLNM